MVTLFLASACVTSKTREIWGDDYVRGQGSSQNNNQGVYKEAIDPNSMGQDNRLPSPSDRNHINVPSAPGAQQKSQKMGNIASSPTGSRPSGPTTHVVRTGDTLWGLGIQYGITVEQIQEANQLNGAFIKAGQELRIP